MSSQNDHNLSANFILQNDNGDAAAGTAVVAITDSDDNGNNFRLRPSSANNSVSSMERFVLKPPVRKNSVPIFSTRTGTFSSPSSSSPSSLSSSSSSKPDRRKLLMKSNSMPVVRTLVRKNSKTVHFGKCHVRTFQSSDDIAEHETEKSFDSVDYEMKLNKLRSSLPFGSSDLEGNMVVGNTSIGHRPGTTSPDDSSTIDNEDVDESTEDDDELIFLANAALTIVSSLMTRESTDSSTDGTDETESSNGSDPEGDLGLGIELIVSTLKSMTDDVLKQQEYEIVVSVEAETKELCLAADAYHKAGEARGLAATADQVRRVCESMIAAAVKKGDDEIVAIGEAKAEGHRLAAEEHRRKAKQHRFAAKVHGKEATAYHMVRVDNMQARNRAIKLQSIIHIFSDLKENTPEENQLIHDRIDDSMRMIYNSLKNVAQLGSKETTASLDDIFTI